MTQLNAKIVNLINQNKSMKQISKELSITEKQLYVRIKQIINSGYLIEPSYKYDSDIFYNLKSDIKDKEYNLRISIPSKETTFRFIAISDLHIGNVDSDIDLVKYVYEYAAKNNINYILICGDNIEGDYTTDKTNAKNFYEQSEYLIKKYPYDKDIKNVMIFGNHDQHALIFNGFDISQMIRNARYDMIPIGYGQGNVNLKSDSLILFHKLKDSSSPKIVNGEKIILSGHGHMMKTKIKDQLWLCIPSLSYVSTDKTKAVIPGFVDITLYFEHGLFEYIEASHIIITPELITASETRCKIKTLFKNS